MDFGKFDNRAAADAGARMQILHPVTREPLMSDGKPCMVIVRGVASRTIQAAMRARQKLQMAAEAKRKGVKADDARVLEDVHTEMVATAVPFIAGFENVERDGRAATVDDAEWFLGLTFPMMSRDVDDDGRATFHPNGQPRFRMDNKPFAAQVSDFAGEQANFLPVDGAI